MKPLIVITSCARDQKAGCHQAIRETWGHNSPIDYRFILGSGNTALHPDELVFDVPDGYSHVSFKTKASHAWAAENGYGHVLQSFTDTYLNLPAILSSDYESYDYVGLFRGCKPEVEFNIPDEKGRYAYASGGVGYWTSPRATKAIAEAELTDEDPLVAWAEDLWVGTALGKAGIFGHNDSRYRLEPSWLDYVRQRKLSSSEVFSLHLGRGTGIYDTVWMHEAHGVLAG